MDISSGSTEGLYSAGVADLERMAAYLTDESTPLHVSSTDANTARAIGLRCEAVEGDPTRDAEVIATLANRHGYELRHICTVAGIFDSVALLGLIERVHVVRAGAVIVAGLAHLGGAVPAALTKVCSVVMPGHMMLGRCLYPAPSLSGVDRSVSVTG